MKYYIFQTVREYFLAIILSVLFLNILPLEFVYNIQNSLIWILGLVPLTVSHILFANLLSMLIILVLGLLREEITSFFVVLNGMAFGVIVSMYQNFSELLFLLFPHSLFETTLIIVYCALVKVLAVAYRQKDNQKIKKCWLIILCFCIPLWVVAGVLEIK